MQVRWGKYFEKTKDRPPRELLVEAVRYVENKGKALDIGAGALMDTKHLLAEGFAEVTAIDADEAFPELAGGIDDHRLVAINDSILNLKSEPETYDLVNAQRVLPYLSNSDFELAMQHILPALRIGGVFTGLFFGDRDEQILPGGVEMTRLSVDILKGYFESFEILKLEETEEDKESTMGVKKHFHEIGIIARKTGLAISQ